MHCWEKYGRPGNNQDKNNKKAEDLVDHEEEMYLVGFCVEDDDEHQENQDNQDDKVTYQVQEEPKAKEKTTQQVRENGSQNQYGCNRSRTIVWNPGNHAGWGKDRGTMKTGPQDQDPYQQEEVISTEKGKRRRMMRLIQTWGWTWLWTIQLNWSHGTMGCGWGTPEHHAI